MYSYSDFWQWFTQHEQQFFQVIKEDNDIEENFFVPLGDELNKIRTGFYYMAGLQKDEIAELILTADGDIKNIVFIEELLATAPQIDHWVFTTHKPAMDIKDIKIGMAGFEFNSDKLHFYANELPYYPDEIDITVVHPDYTEDNESMILNGVYIFLDNALGEINFATTIDNLTVEHPDQAEQPLVPIYKLRDFLVWRQKEFIEKYEGKRYITEEDNYNAFEAELDDGNPFFALINMDLLDWDAKASHPWMLSIELDYGNDPEHQGMPHTDEVLQLLNDIEDNISNKLIDKDGYLNIGRETAAGIRTVYFACKEFRHCSKVLSSIQEKYEAMMPIDYTIYKDKYWRTFDRFLPEY